MPERFEIIRSIKALYKSSFLSFPFSFSEAEMTGWQWHQLDHMQVICTSLPTDNHASTSSLKFFYGPDTLPAAEPTASKY